MSHNVFSVGVFNSTHIYGGFSTLFIAFAVDKCIYIGHTTRCKLCRNIFYRLRIYTRFDFGEISFRRPVRIILGQCQRCRPITSFVIYMNAFFAVFIFFPFIFLKAVGLNMALQLAIFVYEITVLIILINSMIKLQICIRALLIIIAVRIKPEQIPLVCITSGQCICNTLRYQTPRITCRIIYISKACAVGTATRAFFLHVIANDSSVGIVP